MRRGSSVVLAAALSLVMVGLFAVSAMAQDVPRMTKEELKAMLDSPDLVVVDVRLGKDWKASEFKIKGAVRAEPGEAESLAEEYTKDKTLVFYCA